MSTIIASASGGTRAWSDTNTWVGAVVPTAADDVQLDATSGAVTVSAGAVCRSLDCTGYTGTLTHTSAVTLTVGDATAGAGNVALKLVAGMTYTLGNTTTSAVTFASTSATTQTIDAGGKNLGNWTVNGAGSSYQLASGVNTATGATATLTAGALNTNGQTCSWGGFVSSNANVRSLTLGASSITVSALGWSCSTATNMTLSAGTSTITCTGGASLISTGINLSYNNIVINNSGTMTLTSNGGVGTGTIANLTRTGTAVKTDELQVNTTFVITGTLTLAGNSVTNRLVISSNVIGSASTLTVNGTVVASNVDFSGITGSGSASWNLAAAAGGSGDCGGNSGITFTSAAAQTWAGTSGGNWSANAWTSRVPLPQDDVTINAAFTAGQTITMDMPRLGHSITWTGATGAPTWAITTATAIFGDLTLAAGMAVTGTATALVLRGRGTQTLTTAGVSFPGSLTINAGSGSYTLQDGLTLTTGTLTLGSSSNKAGTFNTNGQTVTCPILAVGNASGGSVLTLGASTVNLTGTAAGSIFTSTVATGNAINAGTSTIVVANASANDRNIVAQGFTLATVTYTVAGSTGRLILGTTGSTGTVSVATLNFSDASNARGLRLWAGITLAVLTTFNVLGTSGKLVTIDTSTGGTRATLSKASGYASADYVAVQDIAGSGSWYMGTHSTDGGNNTGLTFADPPAVINAVSFFAFI